MKDKMGFALRWRGEIRLIELFAVGPSCALVWNDYEHRMVEAKL